MTNCESELIFNLIGEYKSWDVNVSIINLMSSKQKSISSAKDNCVLGRRFEFNVKETLKDKLNLEDFSANNLVKDNIYFCRRIIISITPSFEHFFSMCNAYNERKLSSCFEEFKFDKEKFKLIQIKDEFYVQKMSTEKTNKYKLRVETSDDTSVGPRNEQISKEQLELYRDNADQLKADNHEDLKGEEQVDKFLLSVGKPKLIGDYYWVIQLESDEYFVRMFDKKRNLFILTLYLAEEAFLCMLDSSDDNYNNELIFLKENFQCMFGESKMGYFPSEISKFIYTINNKKLRLKIEENNGEIITLEVDIKKENSYKNLSFISVTTSLREEVDGLFRAIETINFKSIYDKSTGNEKSLIFHDHKIEHSICEDINEGEIVLLEIKHNLDLAKALDQSYKHLRDLRSIYLKEDIQIHLIIILSTPFENFELSSSKIIKIRNFKNTTLTIGIITKENFFNKNTERATKSELELNKQTIVTYMKLDNFKDEIVQEMNNQMTQKNGELKAEMSGMIDAKNVILKTEMKGELKTEMSEMIDAKNVILKTEISEMIDAKNAAWMKEITLLFNKHSDKNNISNK